jgi:hypothetical protein
MIKNPGVNAGAFFALSRDAEVPRCCLIGPPARMHVAKVKQREPRSMTHEEWMCQVVRDCTKPVYYSASLSGSDMAIVALKVMGSAALIAIVIGIVVIGGAFIYDDWFSEYGRIHKWKEGRQRAKWDEEYRQRTASQPVFHAPTVVRYVEQEVLPPQQYIPPVNYAPAVSYLDEKPQTLTEFRKRTEILRSEQEMIVQEVSTMQWRAKREDVSEALANRHNRTPPAKPEQAVKQEEPRPNNVVRYGPR